MTQWREDFAASWEDVPEDVPRRDRGTVQERLANGEVVRDVADPGQYVYADGDTLVDVDE